MALKPAICTQCGGQIEVDDSKEAGICQFCGTAFITEKVIHQYVTQNNFAGATINIQGGVETENLIKLARRAYELKNFDEALKYYTQVKERNPDDWESVFYCEYLKGNISANDIKTIYDLILKNESMFEKADKCKFVFDTVLSGMYTYNWNDVNQLIETIKYLDSKNDVALNSVIGEMIYEYVTRQQDAMNTDDYNARLKANSYFIDSKSSLLKYFANKEVHKNSLEKSIKYIDEKYPRWNLQFFLDFFKSANFIDKEIINTIFQEKLKQYGGDYKKDEYNKIISTIKEIDPSFIPPKRSSTPEKRKAQSIIFGIVSLIIKIILFAIPAVLERNYPYTKISMGALWWAVRCGIPMLAVLIPVKREDSFISEHGLLAVILGIIVTCCYGPVIKLLLGLLN